MLSLRALRRLVTADLDVIDVGSGTGVIAVTAALLQQRPVRAIDVASAAVEATSDNARRNGVGHRVLVDATDLCDIDDDYDVVVANILAPVLVRLADDLRRVTRLGGRLVISGVLTSSHQHVLDALAPMEVVRTDELDGWACVELRHRVD
jgi:ribosomal protein L11 methyltransferase